MTPKVKLFGAIALLACGMTFIWFQYQKFQPPPMPERREMRQARGERQRDRGQEDQRQGERRGERQRGNRERRGNNEQPRQANANPQQDLTPEEQRARRERLYERVGLTDAQRLQAAGIEYRLQQAGDFNEREFRRALREILTEEQRQRMGQRGQNTAAGASP